MTPDVLYQCSLYVEARGNTTIVYISNAVLSSKA